MPLEIVALINKPHLLIALLAVGAFAGMIAERFMSKMFRRPWRRRNPSRWGQGGRDPKVAKGPWPSSRDQAPSKQTDAVDQLRIVMGADFTIQPLLNKSEARVFRELDRVVIACNPGWQVMAQVSLGEILRSKRLFGKGVSGDSASSWSVIQARDVDRAEPWPDGQDREEDQAISI
ncbi:MAG: hypothetical protein Q8M88_13840 [Phenylobacterium sp.]|uniref:hypothetical protein n=1 Tax=Phenylobacterium sp. TaxID=1871053 RepID=UPI0027355777|nr:hypothetical protein [Phenylobacterium sp.]MDP3175510.1 hypothetical protein [Phenylobacterium sp.]